MFKKRSEKDGRAFKLVLTIEGKKAAKKINDASGAQIEAMLSSHTATEIEQIITHMKKLTTLLTKS